MKIVIAFVMLFTLVHALSKKEIEAIRKELNNELTQLESINDKRSDNNQVGSVHKNDASEIIKEMSGKEQGSSDGLDSLWQKMVEQRKASEKRELEKALENTKKSAETNTDLEKLFDENTKKSSKKDDDALEALVKLIFKDKAKKRSMDEEIKTKELKKKSTNKEEGIVCNDTRSDCGVYKYLCTDKEYGHMIRKRCPVTCGVCEQCKSDVWTQTSCERFEKAGYCKKDSKYYKMVKEKCYETCGYCRAPSPPACTMHPQGCCWDKITFVKDGCPECADYSRAKSLCKNLKEECTNENRPGIWMRRNCPVTCQQCKPKAKECKDNAVFVKQCAMWKKTGECHDRYVQQICPYSCNKCKKEMQNSVEK